MRPSDSDFILLHSRCRQIESACMSAESEKTKEANAIYWIELTRQCLDEIEKTVRNHDNNSEQKQKRYENI